MKEKMLLMLTVAISTTLLSFYPNNVFQNSIFYLLPFVTSFVFSLWLIFIFKNIIKFDYTLTMAFLLALNGYFVFAFFLSILSGGLLMPFFGGIGALVVKELLSVKGQTTNLFIRGVLSSSIGLILYYSGWFHFRLGIFFAIIVGLWRLVVGWKYNAIKNYQLRDSITVI